jgi:hypothetical protein
MTVSQRHTAKFKALGRCITCGKKAKRHRTRCRRCLEKASAKSMRYYRPKGRFRITRAMLLENLQTTAARLQTTHLTKRQYNAEGSFFVSQQLFVRLEATWSQLCAWAGLTSGHRKIRCQRCQRRIRCMGPAHRHCRHCRWIIRKRKDCLRWGFDAA